MYDRGVKFGLATPGSRIESILMSLPLSARSDNTGLKLSKKLSVLPGNKLPLLPQVGVHAQACQRYPGGRDAGGVTKPQGVGVTAYPRFIHQDGSHPQGAVCDDGVNCLISSSSLCLLKSYINELVRLFKIYYGTFPVCYVL